MKTLSLSLVLTQLLFIVLGADWALAGQPPPMGQCDITIGKSAPGSGGIEFPFEYTVDSDGPNSATLSDGEFDGGPFSSSVIITELPLDGWVLERIECVAGDTGISFEITDNSFTAQCNGFGSGTCIFFNRPVSNIPALSEWGMITASIGLVLVGVFFALKRRKSQSVA